jgi:NADPH:quinone reductase-like Zn-dependent oxidoreductase
MKAMAYEEYGEGSELHLVDLPKPHCPHYCALVRVKTVGVNHIDYKVRAGLFGGMLTQFPVVPGWDVAGVVEEVHYSAPGFAPGDEVVGYVWMDYIHHGTYAEYVPAPVRTLARKPVNATWEQAAALPTAGLTAYQALKAISVQPGDTLLVHGASGGVGSIGVQLARLMGAEVIGAAREQNHEFLRELGVTPVRYGDGQHDEVRAHAPAGVQGVVDFYGKGSLATSIPLLAPGVGPEQMVTIADRVHAAEIGARWIAIQPGADDLSQLVAWVEQGDLTVHVSDVLPLADAAEAHRRIQSFHTRGRVVLAVE